MNSKASVPETTSLVSSSSGSSSSSSLSPVPIIAVPSYDPDTENNIKIGALKANNSNKSSSSSSSGDSEGGFVSGEEEFETALERPFVGDPEIETLGKGMGGEDIDAYFVGSPLELPKPAMPIAKVSLDDDDFDVESDKFRDFEREEELEGGGVVVGESSVVEQLRSILVLPGIGGDVGSGKAVWEEKEKEFLGEMVSGESAKGGLGELVEERDLGVAQKGVVEELVANDGDNGIENSGLNEGVSSLVGRSYVAGEQKSEVLDGNESVIVTEAKRAAEAVEEQAIVGGGIDVVSSNVAEPADEKLVEGDGEKFTTEGDSVVEKIHVRLSGSKVAVVEDVEDCKDCEVKGMEVPVDGSVSLDSGSDQTSLKDAECVANYDAKTVKLEPLKPEYQVTGVGKYENLDTRTAAVDTEREDNWEDSKKDACGDESESVYLGNNKEKLVKQIEPEADSDAKQNDLTEKIASDGVEGISTDNVVCRDKHVIQAVDKITETLQTSSADEAKHLGNNRSYLSALVNGLEDGISTKFRLPESADLNVTSQEVRPKAENETKYCPDDEGEREGSVTDGETEGMIFGSSEAAKQFLEELEQGSGAGSHSGAESSHGQSQRIDGQIVTDSDEEVNTDEEGDVKELFDSAALAALLKRATGADSDSGSITITSQDGSRLFSVERPSGLGSSLRTVKPAPRPNHSSLFTPNFMARADSENNLSEEEKKKLDKIQSIRVKFLRLVERLGHSPEDSIAAQVLYRLALLAGRPTSQSFNLDTAKSTALQLESEGKDDLNFSLNILVIGKTGVGKSAMINSIFGEEKAVIDAFEPATTTVKEITGTINGVKIRVFDTPGLKSSVMEQGVNRKILSSVKKLTKKCPPDIVLYVDRLDTRTRDLNDLPLLKTITSSLGPSIWRSAIVTLTHAASAPPEGPSGSPLSYEVFVAQRSHVVQQSIGQAIGDFRLMNPSLMNPVSLIENHPACRKNRHGEKVLPNGQTWRPQLLLLCYSMKILSEVSSLSKPQDPIDHRKLFGFRVRSPPLPYLLSWLLQSRTHPELSPDQGGENGDSDIDLDDLSNSDQEEDEDEYDQLPPFKPLRKSQIAKLSKEQRKAYFEEYDYRVKLLQKKQWREELKRMREIKKRGKAGADDYGYMGEDFDQENGSPAAVPVPLPDMVLPPSFDGDNPAYRYRFLEPTSQFLARPVLDTHGWDHDCGYDGVNLEQSLAIVGRFPAAVAVQVTKDKKEFNIHLDSSVSAKHGENGSSMAGFDIQNIGKQLAYIIRGETKFKNVKKNKLAAGFSVTFLGENVATGFKIEDQIALGKRLVLVGSTGTVRSQSDAAYGANVEVRLRESDFPIGQDQSTLGLSLVKWRGDLALGANLQSQFSIGRSSKMAVRVGLNNKLSGQITVRTSSSEQLQIALVGILPVAMAIYKSIWPGVSENYSIY